MNPATPSHDPDRHGNPLPHATAMPEHPSLSQPFSPSPTSSSTFASHINSPAPRSAPNTFATPGQPSPPHLHYHDHDPSEINLLTIDYAGLDACLNESLLDDAFQHPGSATANDNSPTQDMGAHTRERSVSTGSMSILGDGFRKRSVRKASYYGERSPRPPVPDQPRYTFFSEATGMVQASSLPMILTQASLQGDLESRRPRVFSDLLKNGCYWIDVLDPSVFDMQVLSKHFHIHPLTIEDISTEEAREKYEVFRNYYFVCFRTFDQDHNSGSYLKPASMYSVVFRDGIITFHFRPTNHHLNVLRRLDQFHSHITLTSDWINYALMDDITDSFASPIQTIEYEVDTIDELVLLLRENETSDMLRRIGSCRKNVMAISRLLTNKADVIRGLMKRFDDRYFVAGPSAGTTVGHGTTPGDARDTAFGGPGASPTPAMRAMQAHDTPTMIPAGVYEPHFQSHRDGEIMLYLGDILDHVLTMLQSLYGYEKILGRSHSNYLAQISLEINQLSNKTNSVVSTLTFFASLIVPMTFVAGLWGMNVHVPGQPGEEDEPLDWWWGLCGVMGLYALIAVIFGKRYGLI